jgi:hypothetical protein
MRYTWACNASGQLGRDPLFCLFFSSRWEIKSNTIIIFFYFNFIFIFIWWEIFSRSWFDSRLPRALKRFSWCWFSLLLLWLLLFLFIFYDRFSWCCCFLFGVFFFLSFPRNSSRFLLLIFYSLSPFFLFIFSFLTWLQFLTFRRDDGLLYRSLCYHYAAVATAARIGKHLYAKSQEFLLFDSLSFFLSF